MGHLSYLGCLWVGVSIRKTVNPCRMRYFGCSFRSPFSSGKQLANQHTRRTKLASKGFDTVGCKCPFPKGAGKKVPGRVLTLSLPGPVTTSSQGNSPGLLLPVMTGLARYWALAGENQAGNHGNTSVIATAIMYLLQHVFHSEFDWH